MRPRLRFTCAKLQRFLEKLFQAETGKAVRTHSGRGRRTRWQIRTGGQASAPIRLGWCKVVREVVGTSAGK